MDISPEHPHRWYLLAYKYVEVVMIYLPAIIPIFLSLTLSNSVFKAPCWSVKDSYNLLGSQLQAASFPVASGVRSGEIQTRDI